MKSLTVRSPSRVDLAGGTLDLWPLFAMTGGSSTINVAISVWTEVTIQESDSLRLKSADLKKEWTFKNRQDLFASEDPSLALYREVLHEFPSFERGEVITRSQSPVGGGIGGSSSLTISFMKALHQWLGQTLPNPTDLVHWAHNIEARMLRTPTGTQDYFPAASGGLNILDYSDRGIVQTVLPVAGTPLSTHFLVVNTGKSHHSGLNNFDVLTRVVKGEERVIQALRDIKHVAARTKEACLKKEWARLPALFQEETEARLKLTPLFSSPEIERLSAVALKNGASAIKICGAGGGGCVLVWVEPSHREKVVSACQKEGFQILNAVPVDPLQ